MDKQADEYFSDIEDSSCRTPKKDQVSHNRDSLSTNKQIVCYYCQKNISQNESYICQCGQTMLCRKGCGENKKDKLNPKQHRNKFHTCKNNKVVTAPIGLRNNGNTCYINSVVQCLKNLKTVQTYLSSKRYAKIKFKLEQNKNKLNYSGQKVLILFQNLVTKLQSNDIQSSEKAFSLKKRLGRLNQIFNNIQQQDASQFLQYLLQKIQQEFQESKKLKSEVKSIDCDDSLSTNTFSSPIKSQQKLNSFLTDNLSGQLKSSTKCKKCNNQSQKNENYFILTLNFPEVDTNFDLNIKMFVYQDDTYARLPNYHKFILKKQESLKDLEEMIRNKYPKVNSSKDCFFYIASEEYGIYMLKDDDKLKERLKMFKDINFDPCTQGLQFFCIFTQKKNIYYDSFLTVKFVKFQNDTFKTKTFKKPYFYDQKISFNKNDILKYFKNYLVKRKQLKLNNDICLQSFKVNLVTEFHSYNVQNNKLNIAVQQLSDVVNINSQIFLRKQQSKQFQIWIQLSDEYTEYSRLSNYRLQPNDARTTQTQYQNSLTISKFDMMSLGKMLNQFLKQENIGQFYCDKCKQNVTITKNYQFKKFGDCLIIRLGRFKKNIREQLQKIEEFVSFQFQLKMKSIQGNEEIFQLCCVVNHQGRRLQKGHYIGLVKVKGIWYQISDSQVKQINIQNVVSNQAYLLFYERSNK